MRSVGTGGAIGLGLLLAMPAAAAAQAKPKVTAVSQLDLKHLTGTWYEVARLPYKFEKRCAAQATVLFAEGDKPRMFQMGTFCLGTNGTAQENDTDGKADKQGDGRLKLGTLPLFTKKYWVLASSPDYSWVLLGSPNHKLLSVLSRTPQMEPATLTDVERRATAQGFKTDALVSLPKRSNTFQTEGGKLTDTPPSSSSRPSPKPKP